MLSDPSSHGLLHLLCYDHEPRSISGHGWLDLPILSIKQQNLPQTNLVEMFPNWESFFSNDSSLYAMDKTLNRTHVLKYSAAFKHFCVQVISELNSGVILCKCDPHSIKAYASYFSHFHNRILVKYNLGKEEFIWDCSFRRTVNHTEKYGDRNLKKLVILYLQSGCRERWMQVLGLHHLYPFYLNHDSKSLFGIIVFREQLIIVKYMTEMWRTWWRYTYSQEQKEMNASAQSASFIPFLFRPRLQPIGLLHQNSEQIPSVKSLWKHSTTRSFWDSFERLSCYGTAPCQLY